MEQLEIEGKNVYRLEINEVWKQVKNACCAPGLIENKNF